MALCASWADEYNTIYPTIDDVRTRRRDLEAACETADRDPDEIVLSAMTGVVVGADESDVRARARARMDRNGDAGSEDEWLARARAKQIVGTVEQATDRLGELAAAGLDRIMLQHLLHTDLEVVALLGEVAARL